MTACRIPLADWTAAACRRVPATRKREKATRADSLTVWLRAPAGMPPAEIRSRLRAAADCPYTLTPKARELYTRTTHARAMLDAARTPNQSPPATHRENIGSTPRRRLLTLC
jgi:hypothetical protein